MQPSSYSSQKPRSARRLGLLSALAAGLILLLSACGGQAAVTAQPAGSPAPVSFSKDVLPILQSRCVNCHGGQKTQKNLDMTSYASLMAGSDNGSVVTPGDPANSSLIQMVVQGKMPKSGPKLLPAQIQLLTDWVKTGAPDN